MGALPENRAVCVFVASSDNTRDVFDRVFPAFRKHWPDCPYRICAGFNAPNGEAQGFIPIYAPASGWASELRAQIQQLDSEYVVLFLDDFLLLGRVKTDRLCALIGRAISLDLAYLRLTPVRRAAVPRLIRRLWERDDAFELVPDRDPYYSSLQVALWKRSHLLDCLQDVDIWQFERRRPAMNAHHAIVGKSPLTYRHIVERGRWLPDAGRLLRRAEVGEDLGARRRWSQAYGMRRRLGMARFEILGYLGLRLREMRESRSRAGAGRES